MWKEELGRTWQAQAVEDEFDAAAAPLKRLALRRARGRAMVGHPDVEAKAQLGRVRPAMSSHAAHRRANDRME